ncbi:MAG: alpha/beta hydrolase [Actinobacteria bacterium]|nr:alpha/beta hydrolase [Actinomycetota bacterium]
MPSARKSRALVAATVAGLVAAGVAAEKVAARRIRNRRVPELDPLLRMPDDVVHRTVDVRDGGTAHLVERGEGRLLVLLHGVTLSAGIWAPQFHELAGSPDQAGFRVVACDLRGHGESTPGSDGYGLPILARDLADVLEALDARDAIVAGHSMGGMTLMRFCGDHADVLHERVGGLAFVATAAAAPMPAFLLERLKTLGASLTERLDGGRPVPAYRWSGNDISLFMVRRAFGRNPSAAALEQVRASLEAMDPEATQRSVIGIFDHDVREDLANIDVPSVVVNGDRDNLTPLAGAKEIARRVPGCEMHVLDGCGHQVMQERPHELARILRDLDRRTRRAEEAAAAGEPAPAG